MAKSRLQPGQHLHWLMHRDLGNSAHSLMEGMKYITDRRMQKVVYDLINSLQTKAASRGHYDSKCMCPEYRCTQSHKTYY